MVICENSGACINGILGRSRRHLSCLTQRGRAAAYESGAEEAKGYADRCGAPKIGGAIPCTSPGIWRAYGPRLQSRSVICRIKQHNSLGVERLCITMLETVRRAKWCRMETAAKFLKANPKNVNFKKSFDLTAQEDRNEPSWS